MFKKKYILLGIASIGVGVSLLIISRYVYLRPKAHCNELLFTAITAKSAWRSDHPTAIPTKDTLIRIFDKELRDFLSHRGLTITLSRSPECPDGGHITISFTDPPICSIHGTLAPEAFASLLDDYTMRNVPGYTPNYTDP